MQIFAIVVVFVVTLCSLCRFRSTVIIWMVVQTLFNAQVAVKYSAPAMSCKLAVDLVLILIYFFKVSGDKKIRTTKNHYLFKAPMLLMLSSYLATMLLAPFNTMQGLNSMIKYFITNFAMFYLLQRCLIDKKDIRIFIKTLVIVVLLQCMLALYESIFHDNVWLDIVYNYSPHDETTHGRMIYTPEYKAVRYGLVRSQGFFSLSIDLSIFCATFLCLMLLIYRKSYNYINKKILSLSITFLIAGIVMANSKTGLLGSILLLFCIYRPSQILNIRISGLMLLLVCFVVIFSPGYLYNIYSLFDESIAKAGGGSSISLRLIQFETAYKMFSLSPYFGCGLGSYGLLKWQGFGAMLGVESSWMQILPERGIYGGIMYILMYVCVYKVFSRRLGKRFTFIFLMSILTMETVTGIRDFSMTIWGTVLIVLYRYKYFENRLRRIKFKSIK